jgi:hypothetical protein
LAADGGQRLPVRVADDEAGVGFLDGPGRREAARGHALTLVLSSYLCPVFTWCRTLEMGAHHALSWPLLQALFIIAKPLPATSMAARAINKGAFIMRSRLLSPDDPRCRIPSCK